MIDKKQHESKDMRDARPMEGKGILIVNGGTILGKEICHFLLSKGARLAVYSNALEGRWVYHVSSQRKSEQLRVYSAKDFGQMTKNVFKKIINDFGSIHIVIQDLGTKDIKVTNKPGKLISVGERIKANLRCAEGLASAFEAELLKRGLGPILYLTPPAWSRLEDPLRYEMVKAGTIALTHTLARSMASSKVNVNCINPGYNSGIKGWEIEREKNLELLNQIPLRCLGEVQDILETVYFFISDASKYMTGQVLEVAGGLNWLDVS